MNGKMSKMLRKMKRNDPRSKRLLKSLDWKTRTKVRTLHRQDPQVDQLEVVTGVKKSDLYPHKEELK